MRKNVFKISVLVIVSLLIIIGTTYLIDMNRMKNNQPVLFSTWGYDYAPPETIYPNVNNSGTLNNKKEQYFYGKVIESTLTHVIVEPNEGEDIKKSADKISIGLEKDNDALYMVGTNVKVFYSGYVMETYPAKVNMNKIELLSKTELMYMKIIDDIISQSEALNNEAKYISLDIDSFTVLNENEKETLLRYCKKYHSDIKDYSMQELKENGLYDEKNMKIDGILIYIEKVEKITKNSAIMTVGKYRSGLGAIFPKYKLTYKNGNWNIEVLSMAIS